MRTYKVGICDRDIDYSKALMEYVNSDMSLGFQIVIFSTLSHLRDYLETRSLDLIVTDDISECEKKGTDIYLSDVKVLEMSETDTRNSGEGYSISECYIYRYQMVSDICRQIKKQLVPNNVGMRSVSRFICVYSPIGRCGKTRLAKTLAGLDEVRGGLYVGMEDFSDRLEYLTNNMLYPLKMNRSDLEDVINMQIRQEQGIYMSVLSGTYMDTFDVSCSEIVKLKNLLLKTGNFTTICFDIGSAALGDLSVLDEFDRIYMPVLRDEISVRKLEVFMKLLSDMGCRSVIKKIVTVDVPDRDAFSEEMIKTASRITSESDPD